MILKDLKNRYIEIVKNYNLKLHHVLSNKFFVFYYLLIKWDLNKFHLHMYIGYNMYI